MSQSASILCRTCRKQFFLGKWLRDDEDVGFGFGRGDVPAGKLGEVVLAFLARHVHHDVVMLGDDEVDNMQDLCEYDTYFVAKLDSIWAQSHSPVEFAGVPFFEVPCEPVEDRAERIERAKRPT